MPVLAISGYSRNDIRNAFFRALSVPALDVYVDTDQRCKAAIDIVVNELENRFPDKPKLGFEWKGESSNLSELKVIDKYGNGLFTEYWIAEPTELGLKGEQALEEPDAPEVQDAPEVPDASEVNIGTDFDFASKADDVLEVHNTQEVANTAEVEDTPEVQEAQQVGGAAEIDDAPEIHDAQVLNAQGDTDIPEDVNAIEVDSAQEVADTLCFINSRCFRSC